MPLNECLCWFNSGLKCHLFGFCFVLFFVYKVPGRKHSGHLSVPPPCSNSNVGFPSFNQNNKSNKVSEMKFLHLRIYYQVEVCKIIMSQPNLNNSVSTNHLPFPLSPDFPLRRGHISKSGIWSTFSINLRCRCG